MPYLACWFTESRNVRQTFGQNSGTLFGACSFLNTVFLLFVSIFVTTAARAQILLLFNLKIHQAQLAC